VSGTDLTSALVDQVMAVTAAIAQDLREVERELGLTDALANLVWALDPDADPLPLRQVAGRLHCDPSNVTRLRDRLEEKGLAERRPHPADGRVRTLALTPAGEEVRRRLLEHAQRASPLAALDTEQQQQLHALLALALAGRKGR
jgi:DNA-binding MarR family transcriptional regulator